MCQRMAEGTRWSKCGHFQRQYVRAIADCTLVNCTKSYNHPPTCGGPQCARSCNQYFGADIEKDVDTTDEYCFQCRAAQAKAAGRPIGS